MPTKTDNTARATRVRNDLIRRGVPATVAEVAYSIRGNRKWVRTLLETHPWFRRASGDGTSRNLYRYTLREGNA